MASGEIAIAAIREDPRESSAARPSSWVATLYFAEGLPTAVLGTLSAVLLKDLGVPNARVAACVSGFMLPWMLRPLWSPLLELIGTKRLFVVVTEIAVALGLAAISLVLLFPSPAAYCVLLFGVIAVCAATHDMAADGVYIRGLPVEAQQRYIGWLGVSFNAAKLAAQALLVVFVGHLAPQWGTAAAWQAAFVALALIVATLAVYHASFLPVDLPGTTQPRSAVEVTASTRHIVTTFFSRPHLFWLLGLIAFYRLAEGQTARIVPLFLLDPQQAGGLGLTTAEFGVLYGGLGGTAFVIGAVLGGWLAERIGQRRAMLPLSIVFNLPIVFYLFLAAVKPPLPIVTAVILVDQLAYGAGSVGLKLAVLSAARGPYETAHCAFAGALSTLIAIASGMVSGTIQADLGYIGFFGIALLAAIPAVMASILCVRGR